MSCVCAPQRGREFLTGGASSEASRGVKRKFGGRGHEAVSFSTRFDSQIDEKGTIACGVGSSVHRIFTCCVKYAKSHNNARIGKVKAMPENRHGLRAPASLMLSPSNLLLAYLERKESRSMYWPLALTSLIVCEPNGRPLRLYTVCCAERVAVLQLTVCLSVPST